MPYFIVALLIIALDQFTKYLIVKDMVLYQSIPVINGFFYITSHRNRGAAFGILQNQQWLFIIITCAVVCALVYYIWQLRKEQPLISFAFSLVLGGAIGNMIDRIRTGEVVDFFHFQFGSYEFPIFNVADSSVCVGVIVLILATIFQSSKEKKAAVSGTEESS